MGLSSAMYTGLTGLNVNQARIETIGHNIANVNTTAYKGSRTLFQTQYSQIMSMGTPPSDESGGTNPTQFGRGAMIGTTQRLTSAGGVETTGMASDLALEGAGYFLVRDAATNSVYYTRDGSFSLNENHELVTLDGHHVRGYAVDANYEVVPGTLEDLVIPLGEETVAKATTAVNMDGDLSAAETLATAGAATASQALVDGGGGQAAAGTALTDLRTALTPGQPLFAAGDTITISGIAKGGRDLPAATFEVGADGNTLDDLAAWLQTNLGIQTDAGLPGNPGVAVENGALVIRSNVGTPNAIEVRSNGLRSSNAVSPLPLQFTQTADAAGTGVFTSFMVYDSLGTPVPVNATFTLESTPAAGPVWRYYVESAENGAAGRILGTGTVAFDNDGNFLSADGNEFSIDRTANGAASPLTFSIDFTSVNGLSTATSEMVMADQDGYPPGTLTGFGVKDDGTITGTFDNGMTQTLGQVVVATFPNEQGLVAESDNLFTRGPNSGDATVTTPGAAGAGQLNSGALETSNVDIAQEFIGLITSSTAYQAATRVISTSNEMLDHLLLALR